MVLINEGSEIGKMQKRDDHDVTDSRILRTA